MLDPVYNLDAVPDDAFVFGAELSYRCSQYFPRGSMGSMDSMDQDLTRKMESQRGDWKTRAPCREWRTSRVYRAGVLPATRLVDAMP